MKGKKTIRANAIWIATAFAITIMACTQAWAGEWKLAKNAKGIQVYTKKIPGSTLKAVKAEMTVNAPVSSLIALMTDFEAFPKWYPQMKSFTCVKEITKLEYHIHIMTDAPWPVKDRDSLCHFKIRQDPKDRSVSIEFTDMPGVFPEVPGVIRVKKLYGLFRFLPLNNGSVHISYETHSDPGGKIPAWMANATTSERPYKIFRNLRDRVMLDQYQNRLCDAYRAMNNLN